VRFVYVDESGCSANDDTLVVTGVILNADAQYIAVEQYLEQLIERYIPRECREGFIFHAKDLFHGTGRTVTDRRRFSLERAREALKELLAIPSKFHIPITFGYLRKREVQQEDFSAIRSQKKRARAVRESMMLDHALTFTMCVVAAEQHLRSHSPTNEIATVVAENNTQTRRIVKLMYDILRGAKKDALTEWCNDLAISEDILPLKKLKHGVHFADKDEAFLLQIADACSFIIRYVLSNTSNVDDLVNSFTGGHSEKLKLLKRHMYAGGHDILEF